MSPFHDGLALVGWVSHGPAKVVGFAQDDGAPQLLADGFTAGTDGDLRWAMRTINGTSFNVHTAYTVAPHHLRWRHARWYGRHGPQETLRSRTRRQAGARTQLRLPRNWPGPAALTKAAARKRPRRQ